MGGRGSRSGSGSNSRTAGNNTILQSATARVQNPIPNVQNQAPTPQNTPVMPSGNVLSNLQGMDDAQLAALYKLSQQTDLPNHLNDVSDVTQKFVYTVQLNDKPTVLNSADFQQFLQDNNISNSQILSRSVNGGVLKTSAGNQTGLSSRDVIDMMLYSRFNYIGGKLNGQAYGAGTYFDMNGGRSTGYGQNTVNAVLNPATARVVTDSQLSRLARAFDASHPQFARATGGYNSNFSGGRNNMSVYALVMGYNVIKDATGSYHNVIDRGALVYRQ